MATATMTTTIPAGSAHAHANADAASQDDNMSISSMNSVFSFMEGVIEFWETLGSSIRGEMFDEEGYLKRRLERIEREMEKERERVEKEKERERQREERDRERRWSQFKKDEAFVMDVMNRELEREQQVLEKKRERKAVMEFKALQKKHRAKLIAMQRNQKRNASIRKYLENDLSGWVIEVKDGECDSTAEMEDAEWEGNTNTTPQQQQQQRQQRAYYDDEEEEEDGYRKSIRWCISVDVEQERRKEHRLTNPVKPGGMARRVRRNPDRYMPQADEGEDPANDDNEEEEEVEEEKKVEQEYEEEGIEVSDLPVEL